MVNTPIDLDYLHTNPQRAVSNPLEHVVMLPSLGDRCLMAIGNDRRPPKKDDYEEGFFLGPNGAYNNNKGGYRWMNLDGCINTYGYGCCTFKPLAI